MLTLSLRAILCCGISGPLMIAQQEVAAKTPTAAKMVFSLFKPRNIKKKSLYKKYKNNFLSGRLQDRARDAEDLNESRRRILEFKRHVYEAGSLASKPSASLHAIYVHRWPNRRLFRPLCFS